jgi:uncharacterized protein (DUF1501 family)
VTTSPPAPGRRIGHVNGQDRTDIGPFAKKGLTFGRIKPTVRENISGPDATTGGLSTGGTARLPSRAAQRPSSHWISSEGLGRAERRAQPEERSLAAQEPVRARSWATPCRLLVEIGPEGWTPTQQPPEFSPSLLLLPRDLYFYPRRKRKR